MLIKVFDEWLNPAKILRLKPTDDKYYLGAGVEVHLSENQIVWFCRNLDALAIEINRLTNLMGV